MSNQIKNANELWLMFCILRIILMHLFSYKRVWNLIFTWKRKSIAETSVCRGVCREPSLWKWLQTQWIKCENISCQIKMSIALSSWVYDFFIFILFIFFCCMQYHFNLRGLFKVQKQVNSLKISNHILFLVSHKSGQYQNKNMLFVI